MRRRGLEWACVVLLVLICAGAIRAEEAAGPEVCQAQPYAEKMQCYRTHLEDLLQTQGTEQALTALEQITARDGEALREAHPLVHHIGQQSFGKYGTATAAMSHCRDVFWSSTLR